MTKKAEKQKDFAEIDFNQVMTDFKGKPIEQRSLLSEGKEPEEGAKVIEEKVGNEMKKIQIIQQEYAEVVGAALGSEQINKDKTGKEKMKNAKLAERIFLADGPISISGKQAEAIINAVGEIYPPMYLMKVADLVDPDDTLGLFKD